MTDGFFVPCGTFPLYDVPAIVRELRKPCAETEVAARRRFSVIEVFIVVSR